MKIAQLPSQSYWLNQIHGTHIIDFAKKKMLIGDATYSCERNKCVS